MVLMIGSKDELNTQLSQAGEKLVVIDFYAQWCGPCKMIGPKLEELSTTMTNVVFVKVDVDECDELAVEYGIESMPTFIFMKNGQKLETFSGANYDRLRQTIEKHM